MLCRRMSLLLVALSLPASVLVGCGDDGRSCAEGTIAQGGRCVPAPDRCPAGQVFVGGVCTEPPAAIECENGTVLNATGTGCIPDGDLCDGDQVWNGTECVDAITCADGTTLVDGECIPDLDLCPVDQLWDGSECVDAVTCEEGTVEDENGNCVPDDDLCPEGQGWIGGECVDVIGCGDGTILDVVESECVPVDPLADVDVTEGVEPNDLVFDGGVATPFTLPAAINETIILGGTIGPAANLDDDPRTLEADFDSWTFTGIAGQRILIEGTAIGAPSVAFAVQHRDANQAIDYQRFALPYATRNGAREVVLPVDGTYEILVGEKNNLIDLFPVLRVAFGESDGAADYTYIVAVTPITNPGPTTTVTGEVTVEGGNIADVPQFLINMTEGSLVTASLTTASENVLGAYWLTENDYDGYTGDLFLNGIHSVPAGGLLLTADYVYAAATDTAFDLTIEPQPIVGPLDLSNPQSFLDQDLNRGDNDVYLFALQEQSVLRVGLTLGEDSEGITFAIVDENFEQAFVEHDGSAHVMLDPGQYYVVVQFGGALPDAPGGGSYDIDIERFDVLQVGEVDTAAETITEADITDLAAADDDVYLAFQVGTAGVVNVTVTPEADLDVAVELYETRILALDDEFLPDLPVDESDVLGGAEAAIGLELPPETIFVRLVAAAVDATPTDTDVDFEVELESLLTGLVVESEPNNPFIEFADILGSATLSPTTGLAQFDLVDGDIVDIWQFGVASPAEVQVTTRPIGLRPVDTIIQLGDLATLTLIATNDDIDAAGGNFYSQVVATIDQGQYVVIVDEFFGVETGWYRLEVVVNEFFTCLPGAQLCFNATNLGECAADGSGPTDLGIVCASGCDLEANVCDGITEVEGATRNDTGATAQDLGTLGEGQSVVEGTLEDIGRPDIDWYEFTVDDISSLTIQTGSADGNFDTMIWLTDAAGREIAHNDDTDTSLLSSLPCPSAFCFNTVVPAPLVVRPGTYYVRVRYSTFFGEDDFVPGDYRLTIEVESLACFPSDSVCDGNTLEQCNASGTAIVDVICVQGCGGVSPTAACTAEAEIEPNNTPATAQDLDLAGADDDEMEPGRVLIDGSIVASSPNDSDYYSFTLSDLAIVTIGTLSRGLPEVDTLIRLSAAATPTVFIETDDDDGPGTFSLIGPRSLPAGDYIIEVEHWSASTTAAGLYRLFIDVAYSCGNSLVDAGEACDDGDEIDNDGCTTCSIDFGYGCTGAPSDCAVLTSLGSFGRGETVPELVIAGPVTGGTSVFRMITFTELVFLNGTLTAATGDPDFFLSSAEDPDYFASEVGGAEAFDGVIIEPGTYQIEILAFGATDGTAIELNLDTIIIDLGAFAADASIDYTSTAVLAVGDFAWHEVAFTEAVILTGTLTSTDGDADMYFIDGEALLIQAEAVDGNEVIAPPIELEAGSYFIGVNAFFAVSEYTLSLDTAGPAACPNGEIEGLEVCDDGDDTSEGDGCTACEIDFGFNCDEASPTNCDAIASLGDFDAGETIPEFTDAGPIAVDDSIFRMITFNDDVLLSGTLASDAAQDADFGFFSEDATIFTYGSGGGEEWTDEEVLAGTYLIEIFAFSGLTNVALNLSSEVLPVCLNGEVEGDEVCDDGDDTVVGDGCTACAIDFGFECDGASPSDCTAIPSLGDFGGDETVPEFAPGTIAAGDSVYRMITFTEDVSLTGTLTSATGDVDLYFFEEGTVLPVLAEDEVGNESFADQPLDAGEYMIEIFAFSASTVVELNLSTVTPLPAVFSESFSAGIPGTWTATTNAPAEAQAIWSACDPAGVCYVDPERTFGGAVGPFVGADADFWNVGAETTNTDLTTPVIDLTGTTAAELQFVSHFRNFSTTGDFGTVSVSTDGGTVWTVLSTIDSPANPSNVSQDLVIDLDAYAGMASVRLRFHYEGADDWYWLLDEVVVAAE